VPNPDVWSEALVELIPEIDCPACAPHQFHRLAHDEVQQGWKVELAADFGADGPEGIELLDVDS
jgi:hypothetical protein